MSWDYAELSHIAKEFGGPERFVNAVNYDGVVQGRWQIVIPELIVGALTGLGFGAKYLYDKHQAKKALVKEAPRVQTVSADTVESNAMIPEVEEEPTPAETAKADKVIHRLRKRFNKS